MKTSIELRKFKGEMKRNPTIAEERFSQRLRNQNINFKSQMILGFFICDFVLPEKMLVIEIDGSIHNEHYIYDKIRTDFITRVGFTVIRIKNDEVDTFDLFTIYNLNNFSEKYFRSALGRANAIKGRSKMRKLKK